MRKNYSRQREEIRDALMMHRTHPTAEELYSYVHAADAAVSLSTVYRNLKELTEEGAIRRLDLADGSRHYDGDITEHLHEVCLKCGRITDARLDLDPRQLKPRDDGFTVSRYNVIAEGICSDCAKDAKS